MSLSNMVVLVTGASRGLGRAAAEAFLSEGAEVIATGRNRIALGETEVSLKAIGGTYHIEPLEVTDEAAVTALVASVNQIDILVNNAGIAQFKPFLETTIEEARKVIDINLMGALIVMHKVAAKMVETGGGDIINIASDLALRGAGSMAVYAASKHALLGLGRSVRLELRSRNIRVVTACPGPINTEILGTFPGSEKFMDPGELARTLVHLVSLGRGMEIPELVMQPMQIEVSV